MSFTLFTNSTDGVTITPDYGFKIDDRKIENSVRARSAKLTSYKFSDYRKWILPLRFVNSADKQTINDWWKENKELFFVDDNDTTTLYSVRIANKSAPINVVEKPYDYEWRGKIQLEEY